MTNVGAVAYRGVLWSAIENVAVKAISFITFLMLARILDARAFGLVAIATVYINFLELFVRVGITEGLVQLRQLSDLQKDSAFWLTVVLGIVCLALSCAIAPIVATFSHQAELSPIIMLLAIGIIPLSLTRVQEGLVLRELQFRKLAIRQIVAVSSGAAVGIGMALNDFGVWSLVGQQLTTRIMDFLTLYWLVSWRPKFRFNAECLREIFAYSSRILGSNFVGVVANESDKLIIGHLYGPATLGIYVVGQRLVIVALLTLRSTLNRVVLSAFSRLQESLDRVRENYVAVLSGIALISMPLFGFVVISGSEVVESIFGQKWADAGPVCQIFGLAGLVNALVFPAMPTLKAIGHPGVILKALTIRAILAPILLLLVSSFGLYAAACVYVFGEIVSAAYFSYFLNRMLSLNVRHALNAVLPGLTASISAGIAVVIFNLVKPDIFETSSYALIAQAVIFGIAYSVTLAVFYPKVFVDIKQRLVSIRKAAK